ncbi:hypothetical protein BB561_004667 [Smittium simulii]|uniref:Tyrosinase copper-binding domain-containing protein n=1 Tax=Smittium simulii TaxID=133385 RepID=A0A2T9YEX5_9FUNG|nr:hypothetical protein BB561_004667 [Smittium simulii]
MNTRVEIRSLPKEELVRVIETIKAAQKVGWINWFAFLHQKSSDWIHGVPNFLPWHRMFTRDFEKTMMHYDPKFSLPYWDVALDSASPEKSAILTTDYFGGNGDENTGCVKDGFVKGWIAQFPNNECVKRSFSEGDGKIEPWSTPELLTSDMQLAEGYDDFRSRIEFGLHGQVHNGLGGDLRSMFSPNDAVFFLHHANLDRLWWKWQNLKLTNILDYNGEDNLKKTQVTLQDKLQHYENPVNEVMVLGYADMCYSYNDVNSLDVSSFRGFRSATQKLEVSSEVKNKIGDALKNDIIENPFQNQTKPVTTENANPVLPEKELEKSGISSSMEDLVKVVEIPDMSIAKALNKSTIYKFFPMLTKTPVSSLSVEMPAAVAANAVNYANEYKKQEESIKAESSASANPGEATATSATGTVNAVTAAMESISALNSAADKIASIYSSAHMPVETKMELVSRTVEGSSAVVTGEAPKPNASNIFALNIANSANSKELGKEAVQAKRVRKRQGGEVEKLPDVKKPKMPKPSRLTEEFMKKNNIDPVKYEIYFKEKNDLVKILNDEGYVSPYN